MSNNIMSPAGFGLILLCFLFTFCEVDCGGTPIMKIQGIDLAFGTSPEPIGMLANEELTGEDTDFGNGEEGTMKLSALIAFLASAAGLGLFFVLVGRQYTLTAAAAGMITFICLLILRFGLNAEIDGEAEEMVSFDYKMPYWLALLISLTVGVSNGARLRE
jgi:hypothetical protein